MNKTPAKIFLNIPIPCLHEPHFPEVLWLISTSKINRILIYLKNLTQPLKKFILFVDNSGPEVVYCPPDQNITAIQRRTVVTWISPQFKDNSNSPLVIECSRENGDQFYWGTWNVMCTAYDYNPNNNPAVCRFTIRLKRKYVVSKQVIIIIIIIIITIMITSIIVIMVLLFIFLKIK